MAMSRTSLAITSITLALVALTSPVAVAFVIRWWQSKKSGSNVKKNEVSKKKEVNDEVQQLIDDLKGVVNEPDASSKLAALKEMTVASDDRFEIEIEEKISYETTSYNLSAKCQNTWMHQECDQLSKQDKHTAGVEITDVIASTRRLGLTFPFLIDPETHSYLSKSESKVMFIMRGLSGSGKSTIVEVIRSSFKDVCVCSADYFFFQSDGTYVFDANKLSLAHGESQKKCREACERGKSIVVIDNTNVKRWEMKSYLGIAKINGYVVVLVEPKTPWRLDVTQLVRRNKHGVSEEVLRRKVREFEDVIPLYYGWFLNESCSRQLQEIADHHVKECLKLFPEFKRELLGPLGHNRTTEEAENEMLSRFYSPTIRASSLLHCTSHFCGNGKVPDSRSYHQQTSVQDSCGKVHSLVIAGLTMTKKTLGARVTLNSECSCLYRRPEEENWMDLEKKAKPGVKKGKGKLKLQEKKTKSKSKGQTSNRFNVLGNYEDDIAADLTGISLDDSVVINEHSSALAVEINTTSLEELFPHLRNSGQGRSAHITLKTATGVESVQTNIDVLSVCDIEARGSKSQCKSHPVQKGQACYYGDGICCVYFEEPLLIDTLFSGYY